MPGNRDDSAIKFNLDLDYMGEVLQAKTFPKIPSQFIMKC